MYSPHRREYYQHRKMLQACFKPRCPSFKFIGARGIVVFPEWTAPHYGFRSFLAYIGPMPEPGCHLSRHDEDRDFEPGNVFWQQPVRQIDLVEYLQQSA